MSMVVCPTHRRWTRIDRADGTSAERDCPECPRRKPAKTFLHVPSGRIIRPAIPLEPRP